MIFKEIDKTFRQLRLCTIKNKVSYHLITLYFIISYLINIKSFSKLLIIFSTFFCPLRKKRVKKNLNMFFHVLCVLDDHGTVHMVITDMMDEKTMLLTELASSHPTVV